MRWCAIVLVAVATICGCSSGGAKKAAVVAESKIDSCLSICAKSACLKSLTHIVGGGQINLQGDESLSTDRWLHIPDSALDNFRIDFYDIDGQRVASVSQKCPMNSPVKLDARAILGRKPNGTYFINLSRNGAPIGTAKFVWHK